MIAVCGRRLSKQQQPLSTLFLRQKDTSIVEKLLPQLVRHSYSILCHINFNAFKAIKGAGRTEGGLALLPIFRLLIFLIWTRQALKQVLLCYTLWGTLNSMLKLVLLEVMDNFKRAGRIADMTPIITKFKRQALHFKRIR